MKNIKNFPKILLLTDATFSEHARGLDRTLKNLFDAYPPERLLICPPSEDIAVRPPEGRWNLRVQGIVTQPIPAMRNRFGAMLEPWRRKRNLNRLVRSIKDVAARLKSFRPDIIMICATNPEMTLVGRGLMEEFSCPVFYYAMDDLQNMESVEWSTGNGREMLRWILENAAGLAFISDELRETYFNRYHLSAGKPTLIIHNPVVVSEKNDPDKLPPRTGVFRLAYAGSIWPMHFDALAGLAGAVSELHRSGEEIEFVLYTAEEFWKRYLHTWEDCEVIHGGFIPYGELPRRLANADLLVLPSSFLPEFEHFARASIQTKLTDYMAAGRTILCVGPHYAACNQRLKSWECGICFESTDPGILASLLREQLAKREEQHALAARAYKIVSDRFAKNKIQAELYGFLRNLKTKAAAK